MSRMERLNEFALAEQAWRKLPRTVNGGWRDYKKKLLALAIDGEKRHRRTSPVAQLQPVTPQAAARALAVADIARGLQTPAVQPTWQDVLDARPAWLMAVALAHVNRAAILAAWKDIDIAALAAMDYATLVT